MEQTRNAEPAKYRSRDQMRRNLNKQDDILSEAGFRFQGASTLPFQPDGQRHTQNHDAIESDSG